MATLLRLANIEKAYNITNTQKQEVLKGVTVDFDRGELVGLIGESGCGKSTLINIMGGLDSEYTGSIVCAGKFLRDFSEEEMDDYRKKRVGLIFQNYNLIRQLTLVENVAISMEMSDIPPKERKERAIDLLRMVGLDQYADKYPSQLSGGQQQRVAIARAMANNPSILLADEPTGALDKESAEIVLAILKKIVENGKLVILVTHSEMVASHCSRIVRIDDGVVVEDSKKYDVKIKGEYEKTIMPRPIKVKDVANLSIRNLDRSRSRSLIVSIGMAIGITALVLILNLGLGLTNYVTDVYADALQTMQMTVTQSDGSSFSDDDLDNVVSIDGVDVVHTSSTIEDATYVYGDLDGDVASLSAFYSDYYPTILYGALPSQDGEMMINEAFALLLTEDGIITSVGTQITLTYDDLTYTYTITGIYDDPTDSSDVANAYLTHDDLTTIEGGTLDINTLYITLDDVTYIESVKDDLKSLDFETFQVDNSANQVLSYIDLGTKVLTGVAMISMIVAAIMIFIVLYISIVERTKEIGILRAIGARKKDIRRMFLVEAGVLGFVGGIFGVVFSLAITILTNTVTSISLQTTLISYGVQNYFLGLVVSIIVSLLAGIAPAVKAADMDPVVSLRYE